MTKQDYLNHLKVGDKVTRFFHGVGFVTQGEDMYVTHATNQNIWLHEEQQEYKTDSYYCYDKATGKQFTDQFSFNMFHTIELPGDKAPDE